VRSPFLSRDRERSETPRQRKKPGHISIRRKQSPWAESSAQGRGPAKPQGIQTQKCRPESRKNAGEFGLTERGEEIKCYSNSILERQKGKIGGNTETNHRRCGRPNQANRCWRGSRGGECRGGGFDQRGWAALRICRWRRTRGGTTKKGGWVRLETSWLAVHGKPGSGVKRSNNKGKKDREEVKKSSQGCAPYASSRAQERGLGLKGSKSHPKK